MKLSLVGILSAILLNGCVTTPTMVKQQKITAENYRQMAEIKRSDIEFYSGRYVGKGVGCFPPASGIVCAEYEDKKPAYEVVDRLPMEAFNAQIQNSNMSESSKAKELLHLILADVALSKGYKQFAVLGKTDYGSCTKSYSTDTFGSVSDSGLYSGTSYLRENNYCSFINSLSVIAFNDASLLERGVFFKSRQFVDDGSLHVEKALYVGNVGVNYSDYNIVKTDMGDWIRTTPNQSWKTVYDAEGLSRDLRTKYGVIDQTPYVVKDEAEQRLKRGADLIQKNVVK